MLDPAPAPAVFTVTAAQNKMCMAVFTWQAAVPISNTTFAATDRVGLERSPDGVSQWQELGDEQRYPENGYETFVLLPETIYYFRAYSWSNLVGRGETTEGVTFSTMSSKV